MLFCPECGRKYPQGTSRTCPEDGARLYSVQERPSDPLVGAVLDDRFRIDGLLNKGGMGSVYRATQLSVNREVALKVLRPDLESEEVFLERFFREARVIAELSHPNIVRLIDFGQDTEKNVLYLVMEMVPGTDMTELLAKGRLSPAMALEVAFQVCAALTEPHSRGIVHRDLKPANIILLPISDGSFQVKVLDFGIARTGEMGTQLTQTGMICGTPSYMSPEQAQNEPIDSRTDLYSLGIVLFEMLTGHLPFEAESGLQLLMDHIQRKPPDLGIAYPEEFDLLVTILVGDLLEKRPDLRPASALEVRRRIQEMRTTLALPPVQLVPGRPLKENEDDISLFEPWILPAFDRKKTLVAGTMPGDGEKPAKNFDSNALAVTAEAAQEMIWWSSGAEKEGEKPKASKGSQKVALLAFIAVLMVLFALRLFVLSDAESPVDADQALLAHLQAEEGEFLGGLPEGESDAERNDHEGDLAGRELKGDDPKGEGDEDQAPEEDAQQRVPEAREVVDVRDTPERAPVGEPQEERAVAAIPPGQGGRTTSSQGSRGDLTAGRRHDGSVRIESIAQINELVDVTEIIGDLTIRISVELPNLVAVRGRLSVDPLDRPISLSLPSLERIGVDLNFSQGLVFEALDLSNLRSVGNNVMVVSTGIGSLELLRLESIGGMLSISGNRELDSLNLPALQQIDGAFTVSQNPKLRTMSASNLRRIDGMLVVQSMALRTLSMERLESIGENVSIMQCDALESLRLNRLRTIGFSSATQAPLMLIGLPRLRELRLQSLTRVKSGILISQLGALEALNLGSLEEVGEQLTIMEIAKMEVLDLRRLQRAKNVIVNGNPNLRTLHFESYRGTDDLILTQNPLLEACGFKASLEAQGWQGRLQVSDNADGICH